MKCIVVLLNSVNILYAGNDLDEAKKVANRSRSAKETKSDNVYIWDNDTMVLAFPPMAATGDYK